MRLRHALPVIALLAFTAPAFADEYVIMKVNNQDVSSADVQHMWASLFPEGQAPAFDTIKPEMKDRILRALMAEKVVYAEALKENVDKSDKVQKEIEEVKKKIVVRALLDTKTGGAVSDADVKKEYDRMNDAMKDEKEVHARHILLASEQDAKDAKKKLDAGKSFEDVAKDYSKDGGTAKNGGDLGWFTEDKMVPEFSKAAFSMKKGEISGPVKSSFGWHIIQVEDIRKVQPPAFADVKDQIKAKLQEKKLNDYIASLVKTADVKVFDNKGKEVPFNKNLPDDSKATPATAATAPVKAN